MAIKETFVDVLVGYRTDKHYEELGYKIPRSRDSQGRLRTARGTTIKVKVEHLPKSSNVSLTKICDECGKEVSNQSLNNIMKRRDKGVDRCKECSYAQMRKTKLTTSEKEKSFGYLSHHLIDMWHPDNSLSPYDVRNQSPRKMKFRCMDDSTHSFYTRVSHVANGVRCPICSSSKGEMRIRNFLIKNKIPYRRQVTFDELTGINGGLLMFDFLTKGILIEYDGIQHFEPIDFKGLGEEYADQVFIIQKEHDARKNEYCRKKGIKLIRISYKEYEQIEEILQKELKTTSHEGVFLIN